MSHVWMSRVTNLDDSLRTWMNYGTRMHESCRTCEWAMSRIWLSHVTHMNESRHTCKHVASHIRMSRITHWTSHVAHESWHIYEWLMSNIFGPWSLCVWVEKEEESARARARTKETEKEIDWERGKKLCLYIRMQWLSFFWGFSLFQGHYAQELWLGLGEFEVCYDFFLPQDFMFIWMNNVTHRTWTQIRTIWYHELSWVKQSKSGMSHMWMSHVTLRQYTQIRTRWCFELSWVKQSKSGMSHIWKSHHHDNMIARSSWYNLDLMMTLSYVT